MTENPQIYALPHAVGPEKSILSSILQDPQIYLDRAEEMGLSDDDFYDPSRRTIFEVIREKHSAGKEIELISLVQTFLDRGLLDRIGGPATLSDLYTYSPGNSHFSEHVKMVKEKALARNMLRVCNETIAEVYDSPEEVGATLEKMEVAVMKIRDNSEETEVETNGAALQWVLEDLEDQIEGKPSKSGIPTGFEDLDRMTGGIQDCEMFVIAARPSMGKTAIMMNLCENITVNRGIPGFIVSAEMSKRRLLQRLSYSRAKFDYNALKTGLRPDKGDLRRIRRAMMEIKESPLYIDDTPDITVGQIRAKARRMKREKGIRYIAIDYLQFIRSVSKQSTHSREREVAEISSGIKNLAKELGIGIILLAQLNRGPEGRGDGKKGAKGLPRMSDLRESGSIEQDADQIGLLYRYDYYAEDEEKEAMNGRAKMILAKNRNGPTGDVPLVYIPEISRFESGEPYIEPEPQPRRGRFDD